MKASKENPIYSVYIVAGGTKYNVTDAVITIDLSDQEKQMAQSAAIDLMNVRTNGDWLSNQIEVRHRVYIYADDGSTQDEVFRGYIWRMGNKHGLTDREIALKCYDNLIYLQESEDAEYFSSGKSSQDVISHFCSKWGINLSYTYSSITHSKLALRGNLADLFTDEILNLVKERTGKKYILRSEKDTLKIMNPGENPRVYSFEAGKNAISTTSECSMEGMITKVVILGKADDESDRAPVEATINGETSRYGTLQKIIMRDENTDLDEAKEEANKLIETDGSPKWEWEIRTADVPWIRKGDRVFVDAGDIEGKFLIVASVEHSISNKAKEMTMTLKNP